MGLGLRGLGFRVGLRVGSLTGLGVARDCELLMKGFEDVQRKLSRGCAYLEPLN